MREFIWRYGKEKDEDDAIINYIIISKHKKYYKNQK